MRWMSLFLACQHLNYGTNLREWDDQSWFKVQAVPVFRIDWCKMFSRTPGWRPVLYTNSVIVLIFGRHYLLPNAFNFIIHLSSHNLALCTPPADIIDELQWIEAVNDQLAKLAVVVHLPNAFLCAKRKPANNKRPHYVTVKLEPYESSRIYRPSSLTTDLRNIWRVSRVVSVMIVCINC
jgi:hypothetical protein